MFTKPARSVGNILILASQIALSKPLVAIHNNKNGTTNTTILKYSRAYVRVSQLAHINARISGEKIYKNRVIGNESNRVK